MTQGGTCQWHIKHIAEVFLGSDCCAWVFCVAGHVCSLDMDGFYFVSYIMAAVGLLLGLLFARLFPRLDRLPLERWRAKHSMLKVA